MTTGVYIHIPYCLKKCSYCDFLSFPIDARNAEVYTDALCREISLADFGGDIIDTLYIGGGTPTALASPLLCKILREVAALPLMAGAEITVEANPGTVDRDYLSALIKYGVNRLSMGLQSAQLRLLKSLGRVHTFDDFCENFRAARAAGFKNVNVDLMFALSGQTCEDWGETLNAVIALEPEHISAYSLTPAENTPLWDKIESGEVSLPDDAVDRDMYYMARRMLAEAGYGQYEISNFAKPGFESRHNVNCWKMRRYIGFGAGAHSFDGKTRLHNTEDMGEYVGILESASQKTLRKNILRLSDADIFSEGIILGLRLTEGISESDFAEIYGEPPSARYGKEIDKLAEQGLIFRKNGRLRLTCRGMDFANQVFEVFL